MSTIKQRKAVKNLSENIGTPIGQAMKDAGYSDSTAKTPQRLTESKGFRELADELGLTDELITSALVEDIKAKPGQRVPELTLGAKIKGLSTDRVEVEHTGKVGLFGDDVLTIEVVRATDQAK